MKNRLIKVEKDGEKEILTIFECLDFNWIRFGTVTNWGAGQHPNLILGPAFKLIKYQLCGIDCGHSSLTIGSTHFNEKHLRKPILMKIIFGIWQTRQEYHQMEFQFRFLLKSPIWISIKSWLHLTKDLPLINLPCNIQFFH